MKLPQVITYIKNIIFCITSFLKFALVMRSFTYISRTEI